MSKELFISSSPHETKVAVLEDDLLMEVYYERDTDVGLVGGIYKGRVSRVLPGMQSAFVDGGLERDAFLYVSDFFLGDQEAYDKVFEEAEARATHLTTEENRPPEAKSAPEANTTNETGAAVVSPGVSSSASRTEPTSAEAPPAVNSAQVPPAVENRPPTTSSPPSPGA